MTTMPWVENDGGRAAAGFRGSTRDCVCRAIAIATGTSYKHVYDGLNNLANELRLEMRGTDKQKARRTGDSRTGVGREVYERYLLAHGWRWVPTMEIGKGCTVHLTAEELPKGKLIIRLSKHLVAVIDGVIYDTYDPGNQGVTMAWRDGVMHTVPNKGRCVYGYYIYDRTS